MDYILIILVCLSIPIIFKIFKYKKIEYNESEVIVFEYYKSHRDSYLVFMWIFLFSTFTMFLIMFGMNEIFFSIITMICAIFSLSFAIKYIYRRNVRVVYDNDTFIFYDIRGKEKIYNINDIEDAYEVVLDGMTIIFKDKSKIKISMSMNNYIKIRDIFDVNVISYISDISDDFSNFDPNGEMKNLYIYFKGWRHGPSCIKVKIDNNEKVLLAKSYEFFKIELPEGKHNIKLYYGNWLGNDFNGYVEKTISLDRDICLEYALSVRDSLKFRFVCRGAIKEKRFSNSKKFERYMKRKKIVSGFFLILFLIFIIVSMFFK